MKTAIPIPVRAVRRLCREYDVADLRVFGSVLRDDFRADSDVDLLVSFRDGADLGPWMTRYFALERKLSRVIGRPVDLVIRKELDQSENYIRRKQIIETAEPIFVAR